MTYPTCLCSCPFVPLSALASSVQHPAPLSSRPDRCVPSCYSFVLPRLPSLVVLADADATGDSTPRRDVTRTMISGRIFFLLVRRSIRRHETPLQYLQFRFVHFHLRKFLINFDRSIIFPQSLKSSTF